MAASTERQVLGKFVMSLNLGRPLVNRATQGFVHDPFQQVRRANRVSKFLQGKSEAISGAVAIDPGQDCGGRQCPALDCQRELHELGIVFPDQCPIDRAPEKRVDLCVSVRVIGPIQRQFLPAPDARHQFNSQQVC